MQRADEAASRHIDLRYSLGLIVRDEGAVVVDVIPGSPADAAGITPGSALIAVNGRKWSRDAAHDAISTSASDPAVIQLLIQKDGVFRNFELAYHGGERYPLVQRSAHTLDLLAQIARPLTRRESRESLTKSRVEALPDHQDRNKPPP